MYVDKQDGKIGERFYEQKSAEWREDQKDILRRLEEHQDASQSYMDEGIALMELANRAADLFEKQPASEKRRLLEFVLSNSFWAGGELTPEFRQPFDMLADMATVGAQKMAAGEFTSSHHQNELPAHNSNAASSVFRGSEPTVARQGLTSETDFSVARFGPNAWAFRSCFGKQLVLTR